MGNYAYVAMIDGKIVAGGNKRYHLFHWVHFNPTIVKQIKNGDVTFFRVGHYNRVVDITEEICDKYL